MDGVLQAPGSPQEDSSNGFKWGGWMAPFDDELSDEVLSKMMTDNFDLLLGRHTYEIFASYWPNHSDHPIGEKFNRIQKFVVATTKMDLTWVNSTQLTIDELKELKQQEGPDLLVHGSATLVQALLAHKMIDILYTWIYPITLGEGKKLFQDGTRPQEWKLVTNVITSKGAIIAQYVPAGEIRTGTIE